VAFKPEKIFIEDGLQDSAIALRAGEVAPRAGVTVFDDLPAVLAHFERRDAAEAKKSLVVARRAGGFVKIFPTGPGLTPSNWRYFVPAIGCPADCSYCFLQTYHLASVPVVFADQSAMLAEIEAASREVSGGYFYGGELCDDLMLEPILGAVGPLVSLFRAMPKATLELRTKSDEIDALLAVGGVPPNVIISWTLTPAETARLSESGAPGPEERIGAARQAQRHGYRVGLRLDPIALEGDWCEAYRGLFERISSALDPALVESVHLGCVRYPPALKALVARRFGRTAPFIGEAVVSSDGKFRYPRPLRTAAYAAIARMAADWAPGVPVKLVMETPAVSTDFKYLAAQPQKSPNGQE